MSSGINVLLPCIPAETNVCVFLFRECYWVGSWRKNWFSHKIMRTQWAVHAAVPIKMFHPKLAKSEMWHCVSYDKLFQSRERGPWEGSPREDIGVSVGWAVWSWLPVWCHWPDTCRRQLLQEWHLSQKLLSGYLLLSCLWIPGGTAWQGFGLCTLKTKALSLQGISDKLVLRQSLQNCVLFINCQNVWGFFP